MNLLKTVQTFATEDQALDYLVASRLPDGIHRLACDHGKVYQIDGRGKTGKPFRRQVNAARFLPCEKHMVLHHPYLEADRRQLSATIVQPSSKRGSLTHTEGDALRASPSSPSVHRFRRHS